MTLRLALKIMKMSKMALSEKYGGISKGLAKRVQAGIKVKKSGMLRKPKPKVKMSKSRRKIRDARKEKEEMLGYERKQKQKSDAAYAEYRDHFDEKGRRLD